MNSCGHFKLIRIDHPTYPEVTCNLAMYVNGTIYLGIAWFIQPCVKTRADDPAKSSYTVGYNSTTTAPIDFPASPNRFSNKKGNKEVTRLANRRGYNWRSSNKGTPSRGFECTILLIPPRNVVYCKGPFRKFPIHSSRDRTLFYTPNFS